METRKRESWRWGREREWACRLLMGRRREWWRKEEEDRKKRPPSAFYA